MGGTNTTSQSGGGGASGSWAPEAREASFSPAGRSETQGDGGWAGHITQFPRMRSEACLTDLQRGRRHHVLSGGRRWPLGLDRAATMVMAGRSGDERDGRARVGEASREASGAEPGSQGWPGPGPAEARAARLQEALGTEKGARGQRRRRRRASSPETGRGGVRAERSGRQGPR